MKRRHATGLTLIEVLVAMAVFAVVAAMAYGGLNTLLRHAEGQQQTAARLQALQVAMQVLQADLEQALGRAAEDPPGLATTKPLAGRATPPRLELQRFLDVHAPPGAATRRLNIAYDLEEDQLVRSLRAHPGTGLPPRKAILLGAVDKLRWRFADGEGRWHRSWPPRAGQSTGESSLPSAVELELTLSDWGDIRRVYRLPAF